MRRGLRKASYTVTVGLVFTASMLLNLGSATAGPASKSFPNCPQLGEGMRGPCVTLLKGKLNKVNPGYRLALRNDYFGAATRIAVLDFQGRNHLPADGRVGLVTARELIRQAPDVPAARPPATPSQCVPPAHTPTTTPGGC